MVHPHRDLRTPHGLEPTAKCEALAAPIARALEDLRGAIEPKDFDPATTEIVFRVAAVDAVLLRSLVARLLNSAPHARVDVLVCQPTSAVALLDAREADVAIAPLHPVPAHIAARELFPVDLVVAMREGHPLAGRALTIDDVVEYPHVVVRFVGPVRTAIDDAFEAAGKKRRIAVAVGSFLAVPHVLAGSDAIAILPGPFARKLAADGALAAAPLPSGLPTPDLRMRLLWPAHADRSPSSRSLRTRIVEAASAEEGRARRASRPG